MEEVHQGLNELFKYVFITNCHLDADSITAEEMNTLENLDIMEVLDNFRDIVIDLLNFKKELKSTNVIEISKLNKQYQDIIRKLKDEIKNHVRNEKDLKLQVEDSQNKIKGLNKAILESRRQTTSEKKIKEPKNNSLKIAEINQCKDTRKAKRRKSTQSSIKSLDKSPTFKIIPSAKSKQHATKSMKPRTFINFQHSRSNSNLGAIPVKKLLKKTK